MDGTDLAPTRPARQRKPGEPPGWAKILILAFVAFAIGMAFVIGDGGHSKHVSRSNYPATWPLTVDSGTLECYSGRVTIKVGTTQYALNGIAAGDGSYTPIDSIWADDPSLPGLKKGLGVLINDGLKLC